MASSRLTLPMARRAVGLPGSVPTPPPALPTSRGTTVQLSPTRNMLPWGLGQANVDSFLLKLKPVWTPGVPTGTLRGRPVRCARAKSRLFSTTGSHGSQGPAFCTPDAVLKGSCFCGWVVFRGVPGINTVRIGAAPALCENAPLLDL